MHDVLNWLTASKHVGRMLVASSDRPFGFDMTIEGMQSQKFSIAIFIFLIISIAVFSGIAFAFMFKDKQQGMKRGERILFAWILFGVVVALIFGAMQLLYGNLF